MKILISSSKTMTKRVCPVDDSYYSEPFFRSEAIPINDQLKNLSLEELTKLMKISNKLAIITKNNIDNFSSSKNKSHPAICYFAGDIYKGLQYLNWGPDDYNYANDHLVIISGLYGYLKPFDLINNYRLEMGYPLKIANQSLTSFWSSKITNKLSDESTLINLLSLEYSKVISPKIANKIISPIFLTQMNNEPPKFIAIHAKLARGLMASWLIKNKITETKDLLSFSQNNYYLSEELTKDNRQPVFIYKQLKQ